jgi:hypothetical protein
MHGENFLLAVARIALTFVTFASIVNLMRHRGGAWAPNEIMGLKLIVKFDLAATAFALLPFPLFYSLNSESLVWRVSGTLLSVFFLYGVVTETRNYRKREQPHPDLPRHPRLFSWGFILPTVLAILLEGVCAVKPSLGLYSWGLLWLICPPAIQFLVYLSHFGEDVRLHIPMTAHDPNVKPAEDKRENTVA